MGKKISKAEKAMTVAQALACATKIYSFKPCSAAEQRAALRTIGWALKSGRVKSSVKKVGRMTKKGRFYARRK